MIRDLEINISALMTKSIVACLVLFLAALPMNNHAQSVLTVEDAVAVALEKNYDIRLAKTDSIRLGLDYTYRNVVFLPRINATLENIWTNNNQNQEFSDGTDRQGDVKSGNINAAVTLNWTLFDGMKMFALKKKAEEYAKLAIRYISSDTSIHRPLQELVHLQGFFRLQSRRSR